MSALIIKQTINITYYNQCALKINEAKRMIDYIKTNRFLLEDRLQYFQQGDCHVGKGIRGKNVREILYDRPTGFCENFATITCSDICDICPFEMTNKDAYYRFRYDMFHLF